jgi:hypothetical protein
MHTIEIHSRFNCHLWLARNLEWRMFIFEDLVKEVAGEFFLPKSLFFYKL